MTYSKSKLLYTQNTLYSLNTRASQCKLLYSLHITLYSLIYSSPHRLEQYCEAAKSSTDVALSFSLKDIVLSPEMANGISVSNATTYISGTIYFFITNKRTWKLKIESWKVKNTRSVTSWKRNTYGKGDIYYLTTTILRPRSMQNAPRRGWAKRRPSSE